MVQQIRSFGTGCYDDSLPEIYRQLAFFEFLPAWILVFNTTLSLITSDVFFFIASSLMLTGYYYYLLVLSEALAVQRPMGYDAELCNVPMYALPDALFVSTMSYVFVIAFGVLMKHDNFRRMGTLLKMAVFFLVVMYCISLIVNRYLHAWQLAANLGIAALMSGWYVLMYWLLFVKVDVLKSVRRWIETKLGYSERLFLESKTKEQSPNRRRSRRDKTDAQLRNK